MSTSLNRVFLIGNLTRDVESRTTPKGTMVADLGLAVNRVWTDESGEKHEEVTFVDVTLWGRTAEIAHQYLRKGEPVMIEGRLQLDTWDDKQTGQKRSKLKVVGEHLQLLGAKAEGNAAPKQAPKQPQPSRRPAPARDPEPEPDDIPF